MQNKDKKEFIEKKRVEILAELDDFLEENGHDMTALQILNQVRQDDDDEAFDDFIMLLAENQDLPDMETAQELAMELFNYFPRNSLGGKSLAELMPFDELLKMDEAFQKFQNGTATSAYGYTLPGNILKKQQKTI